MAKRVRRLASAGRLIGPILAMLAWEAGAASAEPLPHAIEKGLMLGCGVRMMNPSAPYEPTAPIVAEPSPPPAIVKATPAMFGTPSYYRVPADGGHVVVTMFHKAPICVVTASGKDMKAAVTKMEAHIAQSGAWKEEPAQGEVRGDVRMRVYRWDASPEVRFQLLLTTPAMPTGAPEDMIVLLWAPMQKD
jgi:hypothetical protein